MELTHWKKLHNPDYIGAYALDPGQDLIVTIESVAVETVTGADGKKEQCMVARFKGDTKPMILNATNSKTITKVLKTPYVEQWAGKSIQLFSATVKAFGDTVEALRVRPFVPTSGETFTCARCSAKILPFSGDADHKAMTAAQIASATEKQLGGVFCLDCAKLEKEDRNNAEQ